MFNKVVVYLCDPKNSKVVGMITVFGMMIGIGIANKLYEPKEKEINDKIEQTLDQMKIDAKKMVDDMNDELDKKL